MSPKNPFSIDDPAKRAHLMQLLTGGGLSSMPVGMAQAFWFSSSSRELPEDRSISTLKGEVLVNGQPANKKTRIYAGDTVRTGDKS
ncbi:MAG: RNA-binding S4 domain-containing protein [Gammaproteobacteria bacterium]|nr:RNA-binding S4 domain-containing protein [Gammaproteobacteria bacterium]